MKNNNDFLINKMVDILDLIHKDPITLEVLKKYIRKINKGDHIDTKEDYIIGLYWFNSYFDIPANDLETAVLESGIADYTYELLYEYRMLPSEAFPNLKHLDQKLIYQNSILKLINSNSLHYLHNSDNIKLMEKDGRLYIYANDTLLLEAIECRGFNDDHSDSDYKIVFIDDIIKCKLGKTSDEIFLLGYDIVMFASWIKSIMPHRTKSARN